MDLEKGKFAVLIILIYFAIFVVQGNAQDCMFTEWSTDDTPCRPEYTEIYKDVHSRGDNESSRLCCLTGSEAELATQRSAPNCRATKCIVSHLSDVLCSTLLDRYINGTKLKYEEVLRDPCTMHGNDSSHGVVGLCCQPNSKEASLVSAYGAEDNEFPHQAKLKLPGECGGTVFNKRFIITASHCIVNDNGTVVDTSEMQVILGTNIADADTKDYVYKVTRAIAHEEYSRLAGQPEFGTANARIFNDIALLELDRDIEFGYNIKALEIAPEGFDPFLYADKSVIVGWGTTDTLALAIHLQKANFVLRLDEKCFGNEIGRWSHMNGMENQLLCVGGVLDGIYSYTAGGGDSGGPAVCRKENGHPVLCGVTSFGGSDELCAEGQTEENCPPSVYAEVAHFHDWIVDNAGPQDPETFYQPYLYGKEVGIAGYTDYSYHVHITSSTGKSCGGTLIAPDVVITAAQCVVRGYGGKKHEDLKVTRGIVDLNYDTGETFGVKTIFQQPGFQREPMNGGKQGEHLFIAENYYRNGLAIVKLNDTVSISPHKFPVLPKSGDKFDFGEEISFPRNISRSGQLMSRRFRLLDLQDCQIRMNRMPKAKLTVKVEKNMLCGVEIYSGGSTCDNELGNPLICLGPGGKRILCGVQVFRLCELSIPNGFINMAQHSDWVKEKMEKRCESLLCNWFSF